MRKRKAGGQEEEGARKRGRRKNGECRIRYVERFQEEGETEI